MKGFLFYSTLCFLTANWDHVQNKGFENPLFEKYPTNYTDKQILSEEILKL